MERRGAAVLFLSAGALTFEILLVRVFAIEQFHHFAYMAVGVAMLGVGASGTLYALVGLRRMGDPAAWFRAATVCAAASLLAAPLITHVIPLDPTRLAWQAGAWFRLGGWYVVLAMPFGCTGFAILSAIAAAEDRPGALYGASFVGSGMGGLAAIVSLGLLRPEAALAVAPLLAAVGALLAHPPTARAGRAIAAGTIAASLICAVRPPWSLRVLEYKALPQVEALPGARRVREASDPAGWTVAIAADAFRYAPGLSLAYRGAFPAQTALLLDAELAGAASHWPDTAALRLVEWLPAGAAHALGSTDHVLVLGSAAALDVVAAARAGAARVTALDLHPAVVNMLRAAPTPGGTTVDWIVGDARAWLARADRRFDLISIGPVGSAAGGAGLRSLSEDFLHTVDGYAAMLRRLSDNGVLSITGWTSIPARTNLRIILTSGAALRRLEPDAVARGLVVIRSWGTVTTLVKPSGFSDVDIERLRTWTSERRFDLDWYPGSTHPRTRYNLQERPVYFEASTATASDSATGRFAARSVFDIRPATDARPYPHHFIGQRALRPVLERARGDWLPFAEWGYIALVATLVQGAVIALVLLLAPVVLWARGAGGAGLFPVVEYFAAIGLGYLAAEIALIQQLTLLLGHPVYAVAAVLTVLLAVSGIGSAWSDRLRTRIGWRIPAALALLLLLAAAGTLAAVHMVQQGPLAVRALFAAGLLTPLGLLMGMPFPLGLRALCAARAERVAWAWAANGFASVIAAPLAVLVAVAAGSPTVLVTAALAYLAATVPLLLRSRALPQASRVG